MQKLSGKEVNCFVGPLMLNFENASLSIEDGRTVVKSKGVPNGYVSGDMAATGDVEIDSTNFELLSAIAASSGGWANIEPIDINFVAVTAGGQFQATAYGCLLKVSDLLNADSKGGEKLKHKIEFEVTSPDFVTINGVPYLTAIETFGLFQQMDIADKAAEYQLRMNQAALSNRTSRNKEGTRFCIDCGIEIPEERRKLEGITRCIECQIDAERMELKR